MSASDSDKIFTGSVPKLYESYLVPLIFAPYALDLANRLASRPVKRVLEVAAGTGALTRALASILPENVSIVATDLNQPMLDHARAVGTERPVEWRAGQVFAVECTNDADAVPAAAAAAPPRPLELQVAIVRGAATHESYSFTKAVICIGRTPEPIDERGRMRRNDVVFLDTGYHFAETIGTRDAVEATLPVNLISITPVQSVAEQDATYGKDLYKTEVFALARWRNTVGSTTNGSSVIPQAVIDRAPSAELRHDQKDQDSLPPYDVLDPILQAYIEQDRSVDAIVKLGFDRSMVERVTKMVDRNEYKRRQMPPGPKVTAKAFGEGRRYPIAHRFRV